jgi:hypothetical protein
VRNHHLDARPHLPFVPGLSQFRGYFRGQNGHSNPFFRQDALQPARHVPFLCVDRVDLHLPPPVKRGFHFVQQPPFLGVDKVLIEVASRSDQEWFATLGFGVELSPYQIPETEGPVRVSEESIQGHADHRLVASMLAECLLDVLFQILVRFLQRLIHLDADHFFPVGRKSVGDIFQGHEGAQTHQEAAKQKR